MRTGRLEAFLDVVEFDCHTIIGDLPDDLTVGYRTLFLLERHKDGGHNKEERRTFSYAVVVGRDELAAKLKEYLWLRLLHDAKELRIYLSVNARDPRRAVRNMLDTIVGGFYADDENRSIIERKLLKGARSYVMNPNARASSFFLLDVDNIEGRDAMGETLHEMARVGVEEVYRRPTRNGWHVITRPFNPALWQGEAEIKKDGLLLLR